MAEEKQVGGRFASLRSLRQQRTEESQELVQDEEIEQLNSSSTDVTQKKEQVKPEIIDLQPVVENKTKSKSPQKNKTSSDEKRGPGRPPGRRSNPDYTQISAYIPLDMLLEVQEALAEERKELRKRTPRPVSDLVEELLGTWLKKRKSSKSNR